MEKQVERQTSSPHRLSGSLDTDTDTIRAALGDDDRRLLLAVLTEQDGADRLSPLARKIAARTSGPDREEHLRITLYHNHVPRLESAGLLEYDDDRELVELTARGAALAAELVD